MIVYEHAFKEYIYEKIKHNSVTLVILSYLICINATIAVNKISHNHKVYVKLYRNDHNV